jgi:4-carboxymuconolactone decarboxylase
MTETGNSRAQQLLEDTAPDLVRLTDEVLFGDVWTNPGLSQRDRSLVTVAVLVCPYRTDRLGSHLRRALANGLTKDELVHAITHLAFYAGWPYAMTAITVLKKITEELGASIASHQESAKATEPWRFRSPPSLRAAQAANREVPLRSGLAGGHSQYFADGGVAGAGDHVDDAVRDILGGEHLGLLIDR